MADSFQAALASFQRNNSSEFHSKTQNRRPDAWNEGENGPSNTRAQWVCTVIYFVFLKHWEREECGSTFWCWVDCGQYRSISHEQVVVISVWTVLIFLLLWWVKYLEFSFWRRYVVSLLFSTTCTYISSRFLMWRWAFSIADLKKVVLCVCVFAY